jgi:hypothetical protein
LLNQGRADIKSETAHFDSVVATAMPKKSQSPTPSPEALEKLKDLAVTLKAEFSAGLMWDRLLTEPERRRIGSDFIKAWRKHGTIGMWMKVRRGTAVQGIVEVARGLDLITEMNAKWLSQEIGEQKPLNPISDRPQWHQEIGELRFGDRLIRRVRTMHEPTNIERILNAFEATGWPTEIENPLPYGQLQQQLHQALRSLNKNLKKIRFHSRSGGHFIFWDVR